MRRGTRRLLWVALPILLITLAGLGTLLATAGAGSTVFLPLVVRAPALEEPRHVMPAEVRAAVVDDITDFIENLPHEDFEAETAQILARLRSHPEIETAVTDDTGGMIWATFSDGVTWYIFDDEHALPPEDPTAQPALSPTSSAHGPGGAGTVPAVGAETLPTAMPGSSALAAGPPTGIPNVWYRLLDGLGPGFRGTNPIPVIQAMLNEAGYRGFAGEASLTALRHVGNDGVLYLRTHGLPANAETGRPAALSTSTLYQGESETDLIARDYAHGRLALMLVRYRWYRFRPDTVYAINDAFMEEYWGDFGRDSLVYIDACYGITFDPIIDVLRQKNASVIMGWNGRLRPRTGEDTSRFVFDRLLGANVFQRENPPQRPFDYISVFDAHIGPGRNHGHCPIEGSTLEFRTGPGSFGLLVPSIKRMEIKEEPEELIIHGLFGQDPGDHHRKVTVHGEPLPVDSWTEHRIKVAGFTPDKEGEVVVTVDQRESNKVPITSWRGWVVDYLVDHLPADQPPNTIVQEGRWQLDIRADVHSYRESPGGELVKPHIPFYQVARSSTASYEHLGEYYFGAGEGNWYHVQATGGGPLSWTNMEPPDSYGGVHKSDWPQVFGVRGSIDMENERLIIERLHIFGPTMWRITTRLDTGESSSVPYPILVEKEGVPPLDISLVGFSLRGDTKSGVYVDWCGDCPYEFRWEDASPRHAPTDPNMRH